MRLSIPFRVLVLGLLVSVCGLTPLAEAATVGIHAAQGRTKRKRRKSGKGHLRSHPKAEKHDASEKRDSDKNDRGFEL